jgi:hypothetical protein
MSPPARPIKVSFRIRRNFVSRDWTSIGLRGARATSSYARVRTKLGYPGTGTSDAPIEELRVVGFAAPAPNPSLDSSAPRKDWRGLLWTALIVIAIVAAAAIHVMQ